MTAIDVKSQFSSELEQIQHKEVEKLFVTPTKSSIECDYCLALLGIICEYNANLNIGTTFTGVAAHENQEEQVGHVKELCQCCTQKKVQPRY